MLKVNDFKAKFVLVGKDKKYSLYEYKPTIMHPLAIDFEPMRIVRLFRFWFALLRGGI